MPFARVAVPLAIGILLNGINTGRTLPGILACALTAAAIMAFLLRHKLFSTYRNYAINATLFLFILSLGWSTAETRYPAVIPDKLMESPCFLNFEIREIEQKNITTELLGEAVVKNCQINLNITLKGNNYRLRPGDLLYCHTRIEEIKNSSNPESFDYSAYMRNKGYIYRAYITNDDFIRTGHTDRWANRPAEWRDKIIQNIRSIGLSDETENFAIAVTTGQRHLDDATKQSFSDAGLAHILAVSGLHIGIILFILNGITSFLKRPQLKLIRLTIVLTGIWLFTYFTGLAPSATRASIMATCLFASKILLKKSSSLNALMASAFVILLFSPSSIYEVGFQLSFLAVGSILLFAERLTYRTKYRTANYLSSATAVTVSAQLGTLPLIAYYFHSISSGFLLANLLAVPLLPFFMTLLLCALLLSAVGGISWMPLTAGIDGIYHTIRQIADWTNHWMPAFDNIWIDGIPTTALTAAVFTTGFMLLFRTNRKLLAIPATLVAFAFADTLLSRSALPQTGCFLSDEYSSTNLVCFADNELFVVNSKNDTAEISEFLERNKKFLIKHQFDTIHKVISPLNRNSFFASFPFVFANNKTYVFLTGNFKKKFAGKYKLHTDYAILTNRFYNQLSDLPMYINADTLIFPNEIRQERRDSLIRYAKRNSIPFIAP